jgi:hypothetical protein
MTRLTRVKSFDWKRRGACANQQGQTLRRIEDSPNLFPEICSLIMDGNNGKGDDVKVEGIVMATRLLGTFGRYGVQPFHISTKTDNNDDDDDNDNDNDDNDDDNDDDNNNNAEEADGLPMTVVWPTYHTLTGGHFDGKLRLLVQETMKDNSGAMVVSVTLAILEGRRAPPVRLAKAMVSLFAHSIGQSIWIQMDQQNLPTTTK